MPSNPKCPGDSLPALESAPTLPPAAREGVSGAVTVPPLAAFTDAAPAILPPNGDLADDAPLRSSPAGYEILAELGRGGMGVVYKARHNALQRTVALKMILGGGHASGSDLARFRTEAESIARLQHPHIVQIHEIGEHDGLPYFSLEFCGGGNLDSKLDGTPLPARDAAALLEKLAIAVQAAHDKGVIHRDLKPANVLLADDGTPKITDFGLAKKLLSEPEALATSAGVTQTGSVMGTPSYMAPEQAGGKSKELGPACDIYALGAVLYECLTGRPPFKAATPLDTILQVVSEEPVPPSQLQPKTPRDLETICLKCLQKTPAKRYASAEALAEDLQRFLSDQPIKARPTGPVERTWRWCRRNRTVAALLGLAITLLVLLVVAYVRTSTALERSNRHLYLADMHLAVTALEKGEHGRLMELLEKHVAANQNRDLRGWEWYYLRSRCPIVCSLPGGNIIYSQNGLPWSPDGRRLALPSNDSITIWDVASGKQVLVLAKEYDDFVGSIAWSPDGQRLAAGELGEIKIWDTTSGREERVLRVHQFGVGEPRKIRKLTWKPDSQQLASVGEDKTVKVWNVSTGQEVFSLRGHDNAVGSVSWSPDGQRLASTDWKTVKVWNAATGKVAFSLGARTMSWSQDGRILATSSEDGTMTIWDATTGRQIRSWRENHGFHVSYISLSPDAKRLVSETPDQAWDGTRWEDQQKLWDVATGQEIPAQRVFRGPKEEAWRGNNESASWTPDSKRLATAKGWISVWDTTGRELFTLRGHKYAAAVAWSPDGHRLASAGNESPVNIVKVWDTTLAPEFRTLRGTAGHEPAAWQKGSVLSLAWSGDGQRLASMESGGEIRLWNTATGKELLTMRHPTDGIPTSTGGWHPSLSWTPNGKQLLASTVENNTIKVWDPSTGKETLDLRGHTGRIWWAAWSPDGQRIASASEDGTVRVWNTATGEEMQRISGHKGVVESLAWSPDGGRLASNGHDRTIRIWNVSMGSESRIMDVRRNDSEESLIAWSPDGSKLASASIDKSVGRARTIKLWDISSGKEDLVIQGHTGAVSSFCWSPDSKRLASASSDGTIKIWDPVTGQEAMTLQVGETGAFCVAWSQDGEKLAGASGDGTIRIWDASRGYELAK